MFKEDIKTVFPLLKELYDLDGLILVGSDVSLWKELSEQTNIEDVHYVNTQEQKQISFPSEWHIHEQLLAKEDGIVSYYDLSNSQLSGTVSSEVLSTLWRNLRTVNVREKKALSLETLMSNVSARKNALVVNSFDAVDIVQNSAGLEVVVAHTIDSDDESLTHYSKNTLDAQMKKLGYKAVALLEDKHPQVFLAVYALDKEKQKKELETLNAALQMKIQESEKLAQEQTALKEEKQKIAQALESERANAVKLQKEKEETAKTLQNKNSDIETLKNELKTKIEALSNSLEQEKQNSTNLKKELETLNAALQTTTQKSEKLVQELSTFKEEKQKIAQALETEKANAATLQKEKEETAKALQNKNSEVETLKNELKTKTEALTKSLEQEKQNNTNLKKELENLNAVLQTKTQESEKLAQELSTFKEEKQKVAQALETEKANAVKLQKEKEETAKVLQNKNSEVETLKNELKTKTETLTKSLEQEKQNSTNFKKELETLNAALQTKTQESDKLRDERKKLTEETNTLKNQMTLILQQSTLKLSQDYLNTLSKEKKVKTIVSHCINQDDVLEAIDTFVLGKSLSQEEKFDVCCEFALQIAKNGDRFQGVSFINNAKYFLAEDEKNKEQYLKLIDISIKLNQLDLTIDLEMEYNEKYGHYSPELNKKLSEKYKNIRSASQKKQQHGHDLLIDYIETNVKDGEGNGKVMVEIGTTRENIPGQGSTLQLARLCKRKGIKFITVDMDPHNTRWANFISERYKLNIEAVTEKGEVFLKKHIDTFDFVFLDAYDFDHGMHSDLRQSRYKQFLGNKIDEKKAHKMHLKCAKSVVKKLQEDGVVCVDDTWQDENGAWTAKGTLAVPYLLKKNWYILDQRNNAVLMER